MKLLRNSSIFLLLLLLTGCLVTKHILPYAIISPTRCTDEQIRKDFPKGNLPTDYHLRFDTLDIVVRDSIRLKGWFIHSSIEASHGTVIVLHGISSCKEHQLPLAELLTHEGYNVIAFDLPAHGKSEGVYTTFGFYERHDIVTLIDSVLHNYQDVEPIGITGHSLGGAIAVQTMAIDDRIKCGIIQSTRVPLQQCHRL